ncbi:MAG TPA: hypothetical protein EYH07_10715 [Kiloniellaceae bacterium]|nr:hypothetical protein [Kiloniellaceae bacterium]HIP78919.1 hypothetical protein [Kiloniellaceae bacterium]
MKTDAVGSRPRCLILLPALVAVAGCASIESIEQPPVQILGGEDLEIGAAPEAPPSRAQIKDSLAALFYADDGPQEFTFCEASPETGQCEDPDAGLSAVGVGGLFLPLVMDVSGMTIEDRERTAEGWDITSSFDSTVNAIPPICADGDGTIAVDDTGSVIVTFDGFYCNWAVIGNVVTQVSLAIDRIDPNKRSFTGYYALQFNGTGNAGGTGYFKAKP